MKSTVGALIGSRRTGRVTVILSLIFAILALPVGAAYAAGDIVINEVLFNETPGPAGQEEFIELYNTSASTISLDGWELSDGDANLFYTFPPGTSLNPGEHAVVWTDDNSSPLRDAPGAAFQGWANQGSNFLSASGGAIWLHDGSAQLVDYVAWGSGGGAPPPVSWDDTFQAAIGASATFQGQSISLTPNGVDGDDSACWEPTTSGDASGRCAGYVPTVDFLPVAQLWSPGESNNDSSPSNVAPVLDPVGAQAGDEGTVIGFTATAVDPDVPADGLTFTLEDGSGSVPAGAVMTAGGVFTWTPTEAQGPGVYSFEVVVTDDGTPNLQDRETITVTVTEANVAPVLDPVGAQAGDEGTVIGFTATAVDPDVPADGLTFTLEDGSGSVPAGAVMTAGGVFTWTPTEAQGPGVYSFEVVVTDDGTPNLQDRETITVTVTEANVAPVLDPVGAQAGDEGTVIGFTATAVDPDVPADGLTFTLEDGSGSVPAGAVMTAGGVFTWTPTEAQGPGVYSFEVVVTDDGTPNLQDRETITVTVTEANVAPVLDPVGAQAGDEGTVIGFTATAVDPDVPADGLTFTLEDGSGSVPAGAVMTAGGVFTWTPTEAQGPGVYSFEVVVTDDGTPNLQDRETITVTVTEANVAPVLDPVGAQAGDEGTVIGFTATAVDPDVPADGLTFTLEDGSGSVPAGAVMTAGGVFTWTPTEAQGPGVYSFEVVVTDDGTPNLQDRETITVTVTEANVAPVLDPDLPDRLDGEGAVISFPAGATDPDLPANSLAYVATGLPPGLTINADTGLIAGTVSFAAAAGSPYAVAITVVDDGVPALNTVGTFTWTITNTNRPPVARDDLATTVEDGPVALISVLGNDSDPDGDTLTIFSHDTVSRMGGTVASETEGLRYVPAADFAGTDSFEYMVSDGTGGKASATVTVTVSPIDDAPVLTAVADMAIERGTSFGVEMVASDVDTPAGSLLFSLGSTPPSGMSITTAGVLTWTPGLEHIGTHPITVLVTDGLTTVSQTFTITVLEPSPALPPTPIDVPLQIAPIANREVDELTRLSLVVVANDPDEPLTYELVTAPRGATIDPITGEFNWTPDETQGPGLFDLVVRVVAREAAATATFQVAVAEVNISPVLASISDQAVELGAELELRAIATDPDAPVDTLRFALAGTPPTGLEIDATTGVLTWTPTSDQAPGSFPVRVTVSDGSDFATEIQFLVRVAEPGALTRRALLMEQTASLMGNRAADGEAESIIQRTLVLMGPAVSFTTSALRIPILTIVALLLVLMTIGRVGLFPVLTRGESHTGTVAWYDSERGFGYIRPDNVGKNVFIHSSALHRWQRRWFRSGERVKYRAVSGPNRDYARRINRVAAK